MQENALADNYAVAFREFLSCSNEKQVFFNMLRECIRSRDIDSLLDIGAGDGTLAIPLRRLVGIYQAVEPKATYAAKLKEQGLKVITNFFPCKIPGTFQMVLTSHVIPGDPSKRMDFLSAAWNCVAPEGTLAVIVHEEEVGPWGDVLRIARGNGLPLRYVEEGRCVNLQRLFRSWSNHCMVQEITTHVHASTMRELVTALSFVYADGISEHARIFQQCGKITEFIAEAHFHLQPGFPFTHYVFFVRKME